MVVEPVVAALWLAAPEVAYWPARAALCLMKSAYHILGWLGRDQALNQADKTQPFGEFSINRRFILVGLNTVPYIGFVDSLMVF